MFLKLVTWGLNHFTDRIPSMCMMEITLHCYSRFAFGQPDDTLWFLHHNHYNNSSSSSAYCSWKHIVHVRGVCERRCTCACLRKHWVDENAAANANSLFLFWKSLLVKTRSIIFYDLVYLKQKKTRKKIEVLHTKTVINKRLLITCVRFFFFFQRAVTKHIITSQKALFFYSSTLWTTNLPVQHVFHML
jgi:hypothetical protein